MTDDSPAATVAVRPVGPAADPGAAERERLSRQLKDTRVQLAMTTAKLSALEQSATLRIGRMMANAARRPLSRGTALPRDLYRLWRERGLPRSGAANAAAALATAQLSDLAGTGERFLSALTAPGLLSLSDPALTLAGAGAAAATAGAGTRLVITGALSALACATLAPDAHVHPLLPHDADVMLEGTGADLVIIEAAALLPGAPWAYATDPAAADRGRRLARMIVMARSLGMPVVLIPNVPRALMPGIGWLTATCDAVAADGLGVQLARFNPIGLHPARPGAPLYAGDRDPREPPGVRALLDSLTSGKDAPVGIAGGRGWRALPALYRDHAVFVSASAAQAREQLACGARVIGIGPIQEQFAVGGADGLGRQIDAARAASPPGLAEIRPALRDIFTTHATPARLTAISRGAGLPAGLVGGRQVTVIARVTDAAQAVTLATSLLAQRLRPAEVIVAVPAGQADGGRDAVRDAFGGLADAGVRVVTVPADAAGLAGGRLAGGWLAGQHGDGPDWARPLTRFATSPWLAPWPADAQQPASYLLDLACARECAQADAVGFGAAEYEFTGRLDEPALIRAGLLARGGPAIADWGGHGLRLFGITRVSASRPDD